MDITKMRKGVRIGIASLAVVFAAGVSLTSASDIEAMNDTTGALSDNDATIEVDDTWVASMGNSATADNDVDVEADTGDNAADFNTGDGDVDGGDVRGTITVDTTLNSAARGWSLPDMDDVNVTVGNDTTGFSSENDADADVDLSQTVSVSNSATADNDVDGDVNTGNNSADFNTGDGSASSGAIDVTGSVRTDLNANAGAVLNAVGEGSMSLGDLSASNDTTGASSDNNANIDYERTFTASESNVGTVDNEVDFDFNTGANSASFNTGDGDVDSGDTDFDIGVTNFVN